MFINTLKGKRFIQKGEVLLGKTFYQVMAFLRSWDYTTPQCMGIPYLLRLSESRVSLPHGGTMRSFFFLCATMLMLASPARGAEIDCNYFTIDLPADWQTVEAPAEDEDGLLAAVFGNNARTASISLVSGSSEGKDAKELATLLAPSAGATEKPVENDGQYGFAISSNGVNGFCIMTAGKGRFLLSCMNGEVPVAARVIATIKSAKYPEIVPK